MNQPAGHNHEKKQEILFSDIFREHEQRLYILALRLTKSDEVAQDIIQEVFLKLWEHRDSIDAISNMESWLYRIAENKVIDFLRKAALDSRLKKNIWQNLQPIANEPELYLAEKEFAYIIQHAINQLPPRRRLIYRLSKEEGLNYKQIADELQISKHTVKNQLFTAMQSVRGFLARSGKIFFLFF